MLEHLPRDDYPDDIDYSDQFVDTSNLILSKNDEGQLLVAVDSEIGVGALFGLEDDGEFAFSIDSITRLTGAGLGKVDLATTIPLPGDPDTALMAYTVAFARAKERLDRAPDPKWLGVYNTEKTNLINSLTPRQEFGPVVVSASGAFIF